MNLKSIPVVVAVFFLSTGWTVRNLGTLPGGLESAAYGINDRGQIVGAARHADGEWRAVFWDIGGAAIFQVPTSADKTCCDSYAFEINEGATVVGNTPSADGRWRRAFLWKPFAPLAMELAFGRESHGHSINNFGDTVGWGYEVDWSQHGLLWRGAGASVEDIGSLGGFTEPRDVGDGPVVVGFGNRVPARRPTRRAFLWVTGGRMRDLGTLGGDSSEAFGVTVGRWPDPTEESIYVVGHSEIIPGDMTTRAFVWHRGTMTELATVKGCDFYEARAINKNRDIVGRCGSSSGGVSRALLWSGGTVTALNDLLPPGSGWDLNTAFDINERGEIVGVGRFEGVVRAFVLVP